MGFAVLGRHTCGNEFGGGNKFGDSEKRYYICSCETTVSELTVSELTVSKVLAAQYRLHGMGKDGTGRLKPPSHSLTREGAGGDRPLLLRGVTFIT